MHRPDLPEAVCGGLRARGADAKLLYDRDLELDGFDCLVVVGTGLMLPNLSRLLERLASDRCAIIAWVTEPLPPDEATAAMLAVGRLLSPGRWRRVWARLPMHGLSRPILKALLLMQSHDIGDTDARLVRYCIDNLAWLERSREMGALDLVACSTLHKARQTARLGLPSSFIPVPRHEEMGRDLGLQRDVDVLFIGRLKSPRRRAALEQLQKAFAQRGRTMQVVSRDCYGEERTRLINRSRVMLHLHQFPSDTPWTRWHIASANGAAMASEPLVTPEPFESGKDYLSARLPDLAEKIEGLLCDEPRRMAMVAACRETIGREMSIDAVCDRLITDVSRVVAARRKVD